MNTQLQLQVSELIISSVNQELAKNTANILKENFQVSSIGEFNQLSSTVKIINGKVEFQKKEISIMFLRYLTEYIELDIEGKKVQPNIKKIINSIPYFINNLKIMNKNDRIIKENKKIEAKYFDSISKFSVYESICIAQKNILDKINNISSEEIDFHGGLEVYVNQALSFSEFGKIIKEFNNDLKIIFDLIKERNTLIK